MKGAFFVLISVSQISPNTPYFYQQVFIGFYTKTQNVICRASNYICEPTSITEKITYTAVDNRSNRHGCSENDTA